MWILVGMCALCPENEFVADIGGSFEVNALPLVVRKFLVKLVRAKYPLLFKGFCCILQPS
jgi:hypothetical protein